MIPCEEYLPLLPHEYTYAQFLSYEFDIWMYDPMILNMVSERYPRDEDDASDFASDSDSDLVTDEDFSDDIPRWLFLDSDDDEGVLSSLPQQAKFSNSCESLTTEENDFSEFVFGNFGVSYLDMVTPIKPIKPEIEGCMVKIGEINCPLAAVKQSNDGGSGIVASQFMDLESDTVNLQPNTTERIATRFGFASVTDCNNYTKDEAKEITKKEIVAELNDSSIAMTDFIFMATRMSTDLDLAKQLQERIVFSEIVPLPFVFNNDSASVRFTRFDFVFAAATPIANHLAPTSLYIDDDNSKLNESHLYDLFNQINQFVFVSVCKNLATQQSLGKELDLKQISLMDSKKFLHYSDVPFHSPSFCNRSSNTLLGAADVFVYAKSFPDLSVLEEKVKEMEDDAATPWKMREEDELLFADLWNLASSPEPPWEHLSDGIQPQDHGKIREASLLRVSLASCFGPELWAISFEAWFIFFGLKFVLVFLWAENVFFWSLSVLIFIFQADVEVPLSA